MAIKQFKKRKEQVIVKHTMNYLSPSSLNEWLDCPHKFYLKRLSPHKKEIKREPQGSAAAVGSAFDAFVKAHLVKELGLTGVDSLNQMLKDNIGVKDCPRPVGWLDQIIEAGAAIFKAYKDVGALDYALDDGLDRVELWITKDIGNTPTHGRLDAAMSNGAAFDWKIRGYASAPKSPTQGWTRSWQKGKLLNKRHDKCNAFFETINDKWARQLTIYNILMGHQVGDEMYVYFDEVTMRDNQFKPVISANTLRINQIRSRVSPEFQQQVYNELQTCWEDVTKARFEIASPKNSRCMAFNSLCPAAKFCKTYQGSYGDPKFARIMNYKAKKAKKAKKVKKKKD